MLMVHNGVRAQGLGPLLLFDIKSSPKCSYILMSLLLRQSFSQYLPLPIDYLFKFET